MKPDSHFGPGTARADVQPTGPYKYYVLFALTLALGISTADRALPLVLLEPIRRELGLSDTQSGFMAGPAWWAAGRACGARNASNPSFSAGFWAALP